MRFKIAYSGIHFKSNHRPTEKIHTHCVCNIIIYYMYHKWIKDEKTQFSALEMAKTSKDF